MNATRFRTRFLGPSAVSALLLSPPVLPGDTAEEQGRRIALETDRRDTGWGDVASELEMVLRNPQGQTSHRVLRLKSLEGTDDGDKLLLIFDSPADIDGTALLTYTHKTGDDDQWLYLPALSRVKRIASGSRSGSFVGSEFAYEDFTSQEIDKYTYRHLRDETLDGSECFVVERRPVEEGSGYTRQVTWLDQKEYRLVRVDYYDRKDEILKTLRFHDYRLYLDRYWRASEMHMENHQTGKSTSLRFRSYDFREGLTPRDFDQNSLKTIR
jgi:hypothetical protein